MNDKWIAIDEAAEYLGIKTVTLHSWIRSSKEGLLLKKSASSGSLKFLSLMNGLRAGRVLMTDSKKKPIELLRMIDTYVTVCVSNALYQALVANCQQRNQQHQALGQPPEYSEAEIEAHKSKIIDIEPQRKKLLAIMEEVSQYNQNEIQQLSALAREYIAVRQQNAYEKFFR